MPTHNLPKLSEFKLQSQCFLYHWNERPQERGRLFTVNNNSDNKIRAVINQSMGVVPGVADMMYLSDTGLIAIEFKTITGRQSDVQKRWQAVIEAAGYRYVIIRTFEEFKQTLNL
jgi:hypothetical protein